jgi:hypothetical protein
MQSAQFAERSESQHVLPDALARAASDASGPKGFELHVFCPECAEGEFGAGALVELASSRFSLPMEVVGGELIVRSELGPFKLTVTRQVAAPRLPDIQDDLRAHD